MTAVVYSGSKTAFWKIAKDGKTIAECAMPGINPTLNDQKTILNALNKKTILINNAERIKRIYVFTAGATSPERSRELEETLGLFFKFSKITVKDDLMERPLRHATPRAGLLVSWVVVQTAPGLMVRVLSKTTLVLALSLGMRDHPITLANCC